ncbi:MAG: XdhC/CoxI family protein [Phototrophicales bacterium]|nr:MAG: XdhC/CoxI family protein [Phototrophicales bacterium]
MMYDILETVEKWLQNNQQIALATVVETWGSAPRRVGAKMAVTQEMAMVGSVSGGCVETAVIDEALQSLEDGRPRLLGFGVSDDEAWDVGLACGGKISVYVEPLNTKWWQIVCDAAHNDQSITTISVLDGELAGEKIVTNSDSNILYVTDNLSQEHQSTLLSAIDGQAQSNRQTIGELDVLIDVQQSRPKLIIIGGAHVAMALKNYAHILGFAVVLIDPRRAFASEGRFPDVSTILHSYPDKALEQIGLDNNSYVAILTHDPKIDDPALRTALPSKAPYVGVLSSRRTHEKRIKRLTEAGVDPALLKRIHTPIGLDIGAQTPEEIALAIMAQIVAVRNGVQS